MEWNPQTYLQNSHMQFSIGEIAIKKLNPRLNESILDVGCGIGNLTTKIAEKTVFGKIVGIDIDKNMISYAKETNTLKNLSYTQIDGIEIAFHNEFDAVFSNIVLHWIKELPLLLEKLYNALKRGGRIQIATIYDEGEISKPSNPEDSQIKIAQIELPILQYFMIKQYYKEILTLEEFQAYQPKVNKNLTYKIYKVVELEQMIKLAGFTHVQSDTRTFWMEFSDFDQYINHRKSNLWLYFLGFFPEQHRPRLAEKLCSLIREEWEKVPPQNRELPIKEKWPIVFIRAIK